MIGDWVCYSKANNYYTQVNEICKTNDGEESYIKCIRSQKDSNYPGIKDSFNTEILYPIPLTPEMLEKNDFEKVLDEDGTECYRYYNSAADGYIKISLYYGGDGDWSIEIVNYEKFDDNEIVYNNNFIFLKVHQLQHAFRLCGITKNIIL